MIAPALCSPTMRRRAARAAISGGSSMVAVVLVAPPWKRASAAPSERPSAVSAAMAIIGEPDGARRRSATTPCVVTSPDTIARADCCGRRAETGPRDCSSAASARAPSSLRPSLIQMMRSKRAVVWARRVAACARSGRHARGSSRPMTDFASAAVSASPGSRGRAFGAVSSRNTGAPVRSACVAAAMPAAKVVPKRDDLRARREARGVAGAAAVASAAKGGRKRG